MLFQCSGSATIYNWTTHIHYRRDDVKKYFEEKTKNITVDSAINDWKIIVFLNFSHQKNICIFKRGYTLSKSKEKEMRIIIPVPTNDIVSWGIDKSLFTNPNFVIDEKKFICFPSVDYCQYSNLQDFLYDNCIKAIDELFKRGFNLKGYCVKL